MRWSLPTSVTLGACLAACGADKSTSSGDAVAGSHAAGSDARTPTQGGASGGKTGSAGSGGAPATGGSGYAGELNAMGGVPAAGGAHTAGSTNAGSSSSSGGGTGGAGNAAGGTNGGGPSGGGPTAYTTEFDLTESPLAQAGAWRHAGLDWTDVVTSGGLAYGSQMGDRGFDDSYAYLAGVFPPNQSASATIHLESGITAAYAEVEILLRWRDGAHDSTGYECNLAFNGQYAEIIKWPGPLGKQKSDFKFISSGNAVAGGVHDGDVFQADVIGNVITSRLNGRVLATATDSSLPSGGAPGIGFYSEGAPASQKFSFTKFAGMGL
jgi:hypothetical protein